MRHEGTVVARLAWRRVHDDSKLFCSFAVSQGWTGTPAAGSGQQAARIRRDWPACLLACRVCPLPAPALRRRGAALRRCRTSRGDLWSVAMGSGYRSGVGARRGRWRGGGPGWIREPPTACLEEWPPPLRPPIAIFRFKRRLSGELPSDLNDLSPKQPTCLRLTDGHSLPAETRRPKIPEMSYHW